MVDKISELQHTGDESHLLREIMRTSQALLNVFSREVGMPAARLSIMRLLAVSHPQELGIMQIARLLGIDGAAVTRQVKEMQADGMIERFADPRDARRSRVKLTSEGLLIFQQLHERAHEFEKSLSAIISREDVETTVRVLVQLRNTLDGMR